MLADAVFDALHPFHLWAQIAAVCALALGAATFLVLIRSRRRWPGIGILGLCLLVVAFGERSRSAASDLRPIADACYNSPAVSGCEIWAPQLAYAQQIVMILGMLALVATLLGIVFAAATLLARRADTGWRFLLGRDFSLALGIGVSALGTYLTADGLAAWLRYGYLIDINRAGDAIGQIPLIEAIFGTVFGVIVLLAGLAVVVGCSLPRRERPTSVAPELAEG